MNSFSILSICSVVESLTKLLGRAQQVQTCYKKYCISMDVLQATFTQLGAGLESVDYSGTRDELSRQVAALSECQENLRRRHNCLNTMHDQVAEIEALTFTIGEFDVETTDRRYGCQSFID